MKKYHHYSATINWTGNKGKGTPNYRDFERSHVITVKDKPEILGSSDPTFRGEKNKYNPEELLVASLASCHMLWYLHLCAISGVNVLEYSDNATGLMMVSKDGGGRFSKVELNPTVKVAEKSMENKAMELHKKANELCFIANSVNFKVVHNPKCIFRQPIR
jgi:organic hydroperoxide reductase OsmC/OhrA